MAQIQDAKVATFSSKATSAYEAENKVSTGVEAWFKSMQAVHPNFNVITANSGISKDGSEYQYKMTIWYELGDQP